MIIGFVLLGWIGGLLAAVLYLTAIGGSWLAAAGVFLLGANVTFFASAALTARARTNAAPVRAAGDALTSFTHAK
ncbi:MAG: hypothetical protein AAFR47_06525 [Pseudomonadota bacterium]